MQYKIKKDMQNALKNLNKLSNDNIKIKESVEYYAVFDALNNIDDFLTMLNINISNIIDDINFNYVNIEFENGQTTQEKTTSYIKDILNNEIRIMLYRGV